MEAPIVNEKTFEIKDKSFNIYSVTIGIAAKALQITIIDKTSIMSPIFSLKLTLEEFQKLNKILN